MGNVLWEKPVSTKVCWNVYLNESICHFSLMKLVYSYQITICKFRMDALVLSYNKDL